MAAHLRNIHAWLTYRKLKDKEGLIRWLSSRIMRGPGDCVIWAGYQQPNKYAMLTVYVPAAVQEPRGSGALLSNAGANMHVYAHRLFWVLANDRDIPEGMQPDHSCYANNCINPAHIKELVTASENTTRYNRGRYGKRKEASREGHSARHPGMGKDGGTVQGQRDSTGEI